MVDVKQLAEKKTMVSIRSFVESPAFSIAFGLLAFLFYALNIPVVTLVIFALCGSFICLFCEDTRPGLSLVLLVMVTFRYKDNGGAYLSPFAIGVYAVLGVPLVLCVLYRLLKRQVEWKQRGGLIGISLFAAAILIGGIFTEYYTKQAFTYAIAISSSLFWCYVFFGLTMKKREDNLLYLARVCAVAVCVISLEVLEFYLREYTLGTPLDWRWKGKITLGWSISNMVGEMMVFLLPAVFYLSHKEKYGYFYYFVIAIGMLAIYFTFGRNALLWGTVCSFVGVIINCLFGRNKKIFRFITAALLLGGIAILFIFVEPQDIKKIALFFIEAGFNDHGRFVVWENHLKLFKTSPLNGIGFKAYNFFDPLVSKAHNNIVQMLAGSGLVGLIFYLIHRIQTVYMIVKKPTAERLFMGGCILISLLMGMLSSTFFHVYHVIYYTILLCVIEKSIT